MNTINLKELYLKLQVPNDAIAKFDEIGKAVDIDYISNLFYKDEEGFFELLEKDYKEKYLEVLYIYLNLAIKLYDMYIDAGIDLNVYYDTIDDLRIWANNCVKETGVYGLKEVYWVNEHLRMRLFKLGRLQFQKREATEFIEMVKEKGYSEYVKKDYFYFVHIPEGGKLSHELVEDSYKRALAFFKDDNMIFAAESWILSDRLEMILNENSNLIAFRDDFIILKFEDNVNPIKRYLRENSVVYNKVIALEKEGVMIGEGYGICIKYLQ